MKLIINLVLLFLTSVSWSQFNIVTQESGEEQNTFAVCMSSKSSYTSNYAVAVKGNYPNGYEIRILIDKGISSERIYDYSTLIGKEIEFVFYGGGAEHHYTTTTVDYIQNGYEQTVWVVFNDQKLIEYFKKYSTMKVITGSTFLDVYPYSLSNFTACLKKL
jgi:hypothetical protein